VVARTAGNVGQKEDEARVLPKRGTSRLARREMIAGYLFLSPTIILFLVFIAGPLLGAIALSFFKWDMFSDPQWVGLDNFRNLANDVTARAAIRNTFLFTFWSVVLHLGPGLLLALAVNRGMPYWLNYFLRTAYFFPLLVSWAAVSLIWAYILDPNFGFITYYLRQLGVNDAPIFLIDPVWAMPAVIFVDLWKTIGFTFIILLAGLQGIPNQLYEAASIDGAGAFRKFKDVTIPMLSPTLFFASVMTFIGAFQIFEPMYIMTSGGPGDKTLSIVQHIYETGFRRFDMGYASTLALVVFAVIMVVTLLQVRLSRYWVFHE
jgi:multiple sugar transport system permease protein